MEYVRKLEGSKIFLAPIEVDEARKYISWYNDFEIGFFLGTQDRIVTEGQEKNILERLSNSNKDYQFTIVDLETKTAIGHCGLHNIDWVNRTAEFGINIGNKSYWNKGYGTDATELLVAFAFDILNLNNVMLRVLECNPRAIHIYEKVGFKEIGKRREVVTVAGENFAMVYYDIISSEFKSDLIRNNIDKYKKADKNLNKISLL